MSASGRVVVPATAVDYLTEVLGSLPSLYWRTRAKRGHKHGIQKLLEEDERRGDVTFIEIDPHDTEATLGGSALCDVEHAGLAGTSWTENGHMDRPVATDRIVEIVINLA